jgi:excisionase family DNA binding protein
LYPPIRERLRKEFNFVVQSVVEKLEQELPQKKFFTISEVATFLGVSKKSVRRYINFGKLHAYKVGGVWKVNRADLIKFLLENSSFLIQ